MQPMSPYREDGAREPSDGLTPGEREARERRASRQRVIALAAGVPLALVFVAFVLGVLLELRRSSATAEETAARAARSSEQAAVDATSNDAAGARRTSHGPAFGTVEDYCAGREACPTYSEDWAHLRDGREPQTWCVVGNRAGTCNRVETGTCGALHYVKVHTDPTCGGSTRYFDDTGKMVGVVLVAPNHEISPDGGFHDPIRESTYGHVPECELAPSESLCVKPL
jgi:hypothetical protein